MPSSKKNGFDCVAYMRQQRDRIDRETAGFTFEQFVEWFASKQFTDPALEKLASKFREDHAKAVAEMKAKADRGQNERSAARSRASTGSAAGR